MAFQGPNWRHCAIWGIGPQAKNKDNQLLTPWIPLR